MYCDCNDISWVYINFTVGKKPLNDNLQQGFGQ